MRFGVRLGPFWVSTSGHRRGSYARGVQAGSGSWRGGVPVTWQCSPARVPVPARPGYE